MAGGFRPLVPPVTSCRCGHFPLTLPGSFPSFAMDAQTSQHPRPCPRVFLMLSSCLRVLHPPAPDLLQHVPCHLSTLTNLQGSLCLCLSLGHPLLSRLAKTSCGRVNLSATCTVFLRHEVRGPHESVLYLSLLRTVCGETDVYCWCGLSSHRSGRVLRASTSHVTTAVGIRRPRQAGRQARQLRALFEESLSLPHCVIPHKLFLSV